jgi:M6 family metalloprotease-like protein
MMKKMLLFIVIFLVLVAGVLALPSDPKPQYICDGDYCSDVQLARGEYDYVMENSGDQTTAYSTIEVEGEKFYVQKKNFGMATRKAEFVFGEFDEELGKVKPTDYTLREVRKPKEILQPHSDKNREKLLKPPEGVRNLDAPLPERNKLIVQRHQIGVKKDLRTGQVEEAFNPEVNREIQDGELVVPLRPLPKNPLIGRITGGSYDLKPLVLKVEFSDVAGSKDVSGIVSGFETYYEEQSLGNFIIDSEVIDSWYTLPKTMGYYGGNYETNVPYMVSDAIAAADADIDFSDYDGDNDGVVDCLILIHAGEPDESGGGNGDEIWSHYFTVSEQADGVQIIDYMTISEESPVGILGHEFAHYLGLPDLYDTDSSDGDSHGVGYFGMMAYGPYLDEPSGFTPWAKYYLGWLDAENSKDVVSNEYSKLDAGYYMKLDVTDDEYFFLEKRVQDVKGDDVNGVLIWHIDESVGSETGSFNGCSGTRWDCNAVNGDENHKLVDLEEPGSQDIDGSGYGGDDDTWEEDCGVFGCSGGRFYSASEPTSGTYSGGASDVDVSLYEGEVMVLVDSGDVVVSDDVSTVQSELSLNFVDSSGASLAGGTTRTGSFSGSVAAEGEEEVSFDFEVSTGVESSEETTSVEETVVVVEEEESGMSLGLVAVLVVAILILLVGVAFVAFSMNKD